MQRVKPGCSVSAMLYPGAEVVTTVLAAVTAAVVMAEGCTWLPAFPGPICLLAFLSSLPFVSSFFV